VVFVVADAVIVRAVPVPEDATASLGTLPSEALVRWKLMLWIQKIGLLDEPAICTRILARFERQHARARAVRDQDQVLGHFILLVLANERLAPRWSKDRAYFGTVMKGLVWSPSGNARTGGGDAMRVRTANERRGSAR
jgi:hypothetical protein